MYTISGIDMIAVKWCFDSELDGMCKQFDKAMRGIDFIDDSYNFERNLSTMSHPLDENSSSRRLVKAILTAGLYPNVIKVKLPKKKLSGYIGIVFVVSFSFASLLIVRYIKTITGAEEVDPDTDAISFYLHPKYQTISEEQRNENMKKGVRWTHGRIFIHPQSCLSKEKSFECNWLVYCTKIENRRLLVYDLSMTSCYALLFFANDAVEIDHGRGHVILDNWIRFVAPGRIAVLIRELRKMCDYLLMQKIADPSLDISNRPVIIAIERVLKSDGLEAHT